MDQYCSNMQSVVIKEECNIPDHEDTIKTEEEDIQPDSVNFEICEKIKDDPFALNGIDKTMEVYAGLLTDSCDINLHQTIKSERLPVKDSENSDIREEVEFWETVNITETSNADVVERNSSEDVFSNDYQNTDGLVIKQGNEENPIESKTYECKECSKTFFNPRQLQLHTNFHNQRNKLHECELCGKNFTLLIHLSYHLTTHSGGRPYECSICEKVFHSKSDCIIHSRTHPAKNPYKCKTCKQAFSSKSFLKMHILSFHSSEKPYDTMAIKEEKDLTMTEKTKSDLGERNTATKDAEARDGLSSNGYELTDAVNIKQEIDENRTEIENPGFFELVEGSYECSMCGEKFIRKIDCLLHSKNHFGKKHFTCEVCNKSFTRKSSLKICALTHSSLNPNRCGVCKKRFKGKKSLSWHLCIHSVQNANKCIAIKEEKTPPEDKTMEVYAGLLTDSCDINFHQTIKSERLPVKDSENSDIREEVEFRETVNITETSNADVVERNSSEDVFSSGYKNTDAVVIKQENQENPIESETFECKECSENFFDPRQLQLHTNFHNQRKKLHECELCGKKFTSLSQLSHHLTTHSGGRPYECSICEKVFLSKSDCISHSRTHPTKKPYTCKTCNKAYSSKTFLKTHILSLHSSEKPYDTMAIKEEKDVIMTEETKSDLGERNTAAKDAQSRDGLSSNGYELTDAVNIKQEIEENRTENENPKFFKSVEGPYECSMCGDKFIRKIDFLLHSKNHFGKKHYTCKVCNKSFTRKSSLKICALAHSSLNPNRCGVCKKLFNGKKPLIRHLRIHSVQNANKCIAIEEEKTPPS